MTALDRIILALDVGRRDPAAPIEVDEALEIVDQLGDRVSFYKVGWPLYLADREQRMLSALQERGKRIFLDLKYGDIPNTVALLIDRLADTGIDFLTLNGTSSMLRAATTVRNQRGSSLKLLRVTLLTSGDERDLAEMNITDSSEEYVSRSAKVAADAGCDGVICSGREAARLRRERGDDFLIVTPGIRPSGLDNNDQKRPVTPAEAIAAGADYLVIGRPILTAPDLIGMVERVGKEIAEASSSGYRPVS